MTLIEREESILSNSFDQEVSKEILKALENSGINVICENSAKEIADQEVILENNQKIKADAVFITIGFKPSTRLAKNEEVKINKFNSIEVDSQMRISENDDVFAVGDCASKKDFITGDEIMTMLASTASSEARIAGRNLYNLQTTNKFSGTISIYNTAISNHSFGSAGIIEKTAKKYNYSYITATFETMDKHPGKLPNAQKQIVKLIFTKDSQVLIGGEVLGGLSAGEIINIIGLAIQNGMTTSSLINLQVGTHPLLTAAPTAYPIIKAAEMARKKI